MRSAAQRLLVDVQTIQGGFFGNRGIRRYSIGLARALLERDAVRSLLLSPGRPWSEDFPPELAGTDRLAWTTARTLRELTSDGEAVYVATSPFERTRPVESALPWYVAESGVPRVSVLYDLIPEIVEVYPAELMTQYWNRRARLLDFDVLLTLSEHVRVDAIRRLGIDADRVVVVGAGASDFFRPALPGERPRALLRERLPVITRPFVLSVTAWAAHKNTEGLIDAWSNLRPALRRERQLVLTCVLPPDAGTAWQDRAAARGLAGDDVVVTGYVDDATMRALYQEAELLVLPSHEEGFGLPVLEAARCGCPAITSNTSAAPEVLAWEPSAFAPDDAEAMTAAVARALVDGGFRADLRAVGDAAARRHTWDRVAERTARACASLRPARRPLPAPRPRIALVSDEGLDPEASRRVAALAASLTAGAKVHRFDAGATGPDGVRRHDEVRAPLRALGQVYDPWLYDLIVYAVGPQPSRDVVDVATAYPGLVWFVVGPQTGAGGGELTRSALAVIETAGVATLAADPGPFARAVPVSTVAPDDGRAVVDVVLAAAAGEPGLSPARR